MKHSERESYIKAMLFIAMMDYKLEEDEIEHIVKVGLENGLEQGTIENIIFEALCSNETLESILKRIRTNITKKELLGDLIKTCYVTGKYSTEEWEGVTVVSELLGVNEKTFEKIEVDTISQYNKKKKDRFDFGDTAIEVRENVTGALNAGIDSICRKFVQNIEVCTGFSATRICFIRGSQALGKAVCRLVQ